MKFKSRVVHGVDRPSRIHKESEGAHIPPIYQTSTFLLMTLLMARGLFRPLITLEHIFTHVYLIQITMP